MWEGQPGEQGVGEAGTHWSSRGYTERKRTAILGFCIIQLLTAMLFLYLPPQNCFAFLSMLIIFIANNNYNHHNDKSLRQQMKDKVNY